MILLMGRGMEEGVGAVWMKATVAILTGFTLFNIVRQCCLPVGLSILLQIVYISTHSTAF